MESPRSSGGSSSASELEALDLSVDHKPDDPSEEARILAAGGVVSHAHPNTGPARVYSAGGRSPGLAMSRVLGDLRAKSIGIIAEPEIQLVEVGEKDQFVIVASDGVWDFISSREAVKIVDAAWRKHCSAATAAKMLVHEAKRRWQREEGEYCDDITAIVASLQWKPAAADEAAANARAEAKSAFERRCSHSILAAAEAAGQGH